MVDVAHRTVDDRPGLALPLANRGHHAAHARDVRYALDDEDVARLGEIVGFYVCQTRGFARNLFSHGFA